MLAGLGAASGMMGGEGGMPGMPGMPGLDALESFTGGSSTATSGDATSGAHNHNADHSINFGQRSQNSNTALYVVAGVAVLGLLVWSKK